MLQGRRDAQDRQLKDDDYVSRINTIIRDLADGEIYLSPQAYEALAEATRTGAVDQPLSEREIEILRLAKRGLPNPQIAQALHLCPAPCATISMLSIASWASTAVTRRCRSPPSDT